MHFIITNLNSNRTNGSHQGCRSQEIRPQEGCPQESHQEGHQEGRPQEGHQEGREEDRPQEEGHQEDRSQEKVNFV